MPGIFRRGKRGGDNAAVQAEDNRSRFDNPRPSTLVVVFPSVTDKAAIFCNLKNLQGKMIWIKLEIENLRPIVVVSVYRPPQGDYNK